MQTLFPEVQTKITSVLSNPSFTTYGMIGITTVILAALTVFDSLGDNNDNKNEESYVSQLFNKNEDDQQEQEETGLVSALTGGASKKRKKTKKHLKRLRKTHHKK